MSKRKLDFYALIVIKGNKFTLFFMSPQASAEQLKPAQLNLFPRVNHRHAGEQMGRAPYGDLIKARSKLGERVMGSPSAQSYERETTERPEPLSHDEVDKIFELWCIPTNVASGILQLGVTREVKHVRKIKTNFKDWVNGKGNIGEIQKSKLANVVVIVELFNALFEGGNEAEKRSKIIGWFKTENERLNAKTPLQFLSEPENQRFGLLTVMETLYIEKLAMELN